MSSVDPSRAGAVPPPAPAGAFAPLRQPVFAVLWGAMVLGNTGSFMRDVASAWVVTDLSASPAAVALVQTAASLPVFLLALPAGVLSDILDRRRFLMLVQAAMALVSAVLMLLAGTGTLTVETLIGLRNSLVAAYTTVERDSTKHPDPTESRLSITPQFTRAMHAICNYLEPHGALCIEPIPDPHQDNTVSPENDDEADGEEGDDVDMDEGDEGDDVGMD